MNILSINHGIGPSIYLLKNGDFICIEESLIEEKYYGFSLALQLASKEYSEFLKSVNQVAIANYKFPKINKIQFREK